MPTLDGPLHIRGRLSSDALTAPDNSLGNDEMDAARPLATLKTRRLMAPYYSAPKLTAAPVVAEEEVIHRAQEAGTIKEFKACRIGANATGTGKAVINLMKNGVSILSSVITIDSTSVVYITINGGIATPAYIVGDILSVLVTGTIGTGTVPYGIFAVAILDENPN